QIIISGTLLIAAAGKIAAPVHFLEFTNALTGFEGAWLTSILFITVIAEVSIASSIWIWYKSFLPLWISSLLFLIFTIVVLFALLIDVTDSCGCFGNWLEVESLNMKAVGRNLMFAVMAALAAGDMTFENKE